MIEKLLYSSLCRFNSEYYGLFWNKPKNKFKFFEISNEEERQVSSGRILSVFLILCYTKLIEEEKQREKSPSDGRDRSKVRRYVVCIGKHGSRV